MYTIILDEKTSKFYCKFVLEGMSAPKGIEVRGAEKRLISGNFWIQLDPETLLPIGEWELRPTQKVSLPSPAKKPKKKREWRPDPTLISDVARRSHLKTKDSKIPKKLKK